MRQFDCKSEAGVAHPGIDGANEVQAAGLVLDFVVEVGRIFKVVNLK